MSPIASMTAEAVRTIISDYTGKPMEDIHLCRAGADGKGRIVSALVCNVKRGSMLHRMYGTGHDFGSVGLTLAEIDSMRIGLSTP